MNRRRLSDEEQSLWQGVTRSIAPLRRTAKIVATGVMPAETLLVPKAKAKLSTKPTAAKAAAGLPNPTSPAVTPPPVVLGRKIKRRVARGMHAIDGRLDLHGMTQAQAHGALLYFLRSRQAHGARLVLVITGKGGRGDGERGVLKRMVPHWLQLAEFRNLVSGFEGAAITHGGEGALYVTLRRVRG